MSKPLDEVSKEQLLHACKMALASFEVSLRISLATGQPIPAYPAVKVCADECRTVIEMATGEPVDTGELMEWGRLELIRMNMEGE